MGSGNRRLEQWAAWVVALLGPALITAVLVRLSGSIQRDYVFIYLGLVAGVAVVSGLWPALVCAGMSLGHRHRTRWKPWDTTSELIGLLVGVDVHILRAHEPAGLAAG